MNIGYVNICSIAILMAWLMLHPLWAWADPSARRREHLVLDKPSISQNLNDHLVMLTQTIGERSVLMPENLRRSALYIQSYYEKLGIEVALEPYKYRQMEVHNVVARLPSGGKHGKHYLLGAHYDCVAGTVGADDNASAVAVQLETARALKAIPGLNIAVTFVSFALEEPPAYGTRYMGSRVYAAKARKQSVHLDGMICLEMVGYTCRQPGCQHYPFPLKYLGYPKEGTFIGIVGNVKSMALTRGLRNSIQRHPELPVVTLTVPFNGWIMPAVRLSDHASFWSKGYKAVMVTDSAFFRNPHYHLPSDTLQTLDIGYMADVVRGLVTFFSDQSGAPEDGQ